MTGTDTSLYRALRYVHDGKVYDSTDDVVRAWKRGEMRRTDGNGMDDTAWTTRRPKGPARDLDDRSGPRSVAFDGRRFRVDDENDYISWMGWTFYTSFERDMGLRFWDM